MDILPKDLLGHRQRLRERYSEYGFDGLQEHETLEILLFFVEKTKDVQPVAKALLDKFGCLSNVFSATEKELKQVNGVGASLARSIAFLAEFYRKLSFASNAPTCLCRAKLIKKAFLVSCHKKYECLTYMAFDRSLKLVYSGETTQHIKDGVDVPKIEEIMRTIKSFGGFFVFFSHNHPHNMPTPTPSDFEFTKQLALLSHKYRFCLLDHSITAKEGFFSFFYEREIGNALTRYFLKNPKELFYTPARLNHFFFPETTNKITESNPFLGELKLRNPISLEGPFAIFHWDEIDKMIALKIDLVHPEDDPYA